MEKAEELSLIYQRILSKGLSYSRLVMAAAANDYDDELVSKHFEKVLKLSERSKTLPCHQEQLDN